MSLGHLVTVLMFSTMRWGPDYPDYPTSDRLVLSELAVRWVDLPSNDGASGLADDAAAVRAAVAELGEPTVVVGHSYSGVAISEGAEAAAALVYLCAFTRARR